MRNCAQLRNCVKTDNLRTTGELEESKIDGRSQFAHLVLQYSILFYSSIVYMVACALYVCPPSLLSTTHS